jgi:hypothetical protein
VHARKPKSRSRLRASADYRPHVSPYSVGSIEESAIKAASSRSSSFVVSLHVILDHLAGSLHPTQEDLGSARIGNSPLAETAFDFLVTRRPTATTRGADLVLSSSRSCTAVLSLAFAAAAGDARS